MKNTILTDIKEYINVFNAKFDLKERENLEKLEDNLLMLIEKTPAILRIQDMYDENLGMMVADLKMKRIVSRALDDEVASTQGDEEGYNIGMYAALNELEEETRKALKNRLARNQRNRYNENIVSIAENNGLDVLEVLLENLMEDVEEQEK